MRTLAFVAIVAVIAIAGFSACRSRQAGTNAGDGSVAAGQPCSVPGKKGPCVTVWVTSGGELELNGQRADLARIDQAFQSLPPDHGVVLYGREAGEEEPHPTALKVMELIVKHRLPVSMSSKRDFSDVVGADGTSTPRKGI